MSRSNPKYIMQSRTTLGTETCISPSMIGFKNCQLMQTTNGCIMVYVGAYYDVITGVFDSTSFYHHKTGFQASKIHVCGSNLVTIDNGHLSFISGLGEVVVKKTKISEEHRYCLLGSIGYKANSHHYILANVGLCGSQKTY